MDWIDRAYSEIEQEYESGNMTQAEYSNALRELRYEIKQGQGDWDGDVAGHRD